MNGLATRNATRRGTVPARRFARTFLCSRLPGTIDATARSGASRAFADGVGDRLRSLVPLSVRAMAEAMHGGGVTWQLPLSIRRTDGERLVHVGARRLLRPAGYQARRNS